MTVSYARTTEADDAIAPYASSDPRPDRLSLCASAVSWGAIFAGAAAAAALSLILLVLGTGLGLSVISPWAHQSVSASSVGVSTIVWLTLTQLAASAIGGYLAGRLRTRWTAIHQDEAYFRDTAHGLLAWAVSTLVTAALLASVVGSIVGVGAQTAATAATAAGGLAATTAAVSASELAKPNQDSARNGYFTDSLFRTTASPTSAASTNAAPSALPLGEVSRIFMNTLPTGALQAEDAKYVGQLVAQRTGLSQQDAEKRVNDTYARMQARLQETETAARSAADSARKASAYAALWLFISLLAGAFVASWTATLGGRQRDV